MGRTRRKTDSEAPIDYGPKGKPQPDADLRDNENVPLPALPCTWEAEMQRGLRHRIPCAVDDYMTAEVLPVRADAWIDYDKTKLGYEIPLTRHFYRYIPPRPLAEIDGEIKQLEDRDARSA